ncbi:MAG: Zn-finger containing protein [Halonotius sp. J07HN4]|nr:MAG: Zn-finger containing protein [Halonotius sp. J07HN4]
MSDFDKEAEREKLRKKYADDADDRADTKRMSELLLKGATMTNQHCDTCGDPLFRHDGQTFCSTCQANSQQPAAQDDRTQQSPSEQQQASQSVDVAVPDEGATADTTPQSPSSESPQPTTNGTQPDGERANAADPSQPAEQPSTPTQQPTQTQPTPTDQPTSPRHQPTTQQQTDATATPQHSPAAADLTTARQSLVGTVTRFSQQAAKADDPRRAKELLAAAREAAETLRALEFE